MSCFTRILRRPAVLILGAGLFARIAYFWAYIQSPYLGHHPVDHGYYRDWAIAISQGQWIGQHAFEKAPLYSYLLGCWFSIVGQDDRLVFGLQLVAGLATSLLVYACGRRLFDERTAILAGMVTALYGPLIFYEFLIMKTFLSPLLTMSALYGALRYIDARHLRWLALAGFSTGLACLVRENHVLLMLPLVGAAALHRSDTIEISRKRRLLHVVVLSLACGVPLIVSTVRNYVASNELVVVTAGGGEVFYLSHGPQATGYYTPPPFIEGDAFLEHERFRQEAERLLGHDVTRSESSRFWFRQGLNEIVGNPLKELRLLCVKTSAVFNNLEIADSEFYTVACHWMAVLYFLPTFGWIAGFAVLGLLVCLRTPARFYLPLMFAGAHFVSILMLYVFGRFRMGMIPILILFAAHGFFWCFDRITNARAKDSTVRSRWAVALALLLVLGVSIAAYFPPLGFQIQLDDIRAHIRHYELAMRDEDFERAELQLLKVLKFSDGEYKIHLHNVLAQHYEKMKRFEDAQQHYERSLKLKSDPKIRMALGFLLRSQNKTAKAIEQFRIVLKNNADHASANYHVGDALIESNQLDEARVHLNKVVEVAPFGVLAHHRLARVCELQGDFSEAIQHYRTAIRDGAQSMMVVNDLAWLLATAPDPDIRDGQEAISLANSLRVPAGENAIVFDTLAAAHAEAKQFDQAIRYAKSAARLARRTGDEALAKRIEQRQNRYADQKPWHIIER